MSEVKNQMVKKEERMMSMKTTKFNLPDKVRRNLTGGLLALVLIISMSAVSYSKDSLSNVTFKGMVKIPADSFMMGSNEGFKKPIHKVTLDAFYMDTTEVTQAEYKELMRVNPSKFKGNSNRPVETITWYDAVLYCNARSKRDGLESVYQYTRVIGKAGNGCKGLENLVIDFNKNGYRLPTEAEWEYACRAGTTTQYYWGDLMDGDYARWFKNSNGTTQPVGTKKPNAWGLYDMSGNVWEWCHDWYNRTYYASSPEKNPPGPNSGVRRVLRGGSWGSGDGCYLLSAGRSNGLPDLRGDGSGFRCVVARY
jgi:formylglycine-generating enzyme required for sulfatase activity